MNILLSGIGLFAGAHLYLMLWPSAVGKLKAAWGEGPFKGLFSFVSIAGLGLIIWGFARAWSGPEGNDYVYVPEPWTKHVVMFFVLFGFIAIGTSHGKGYLRLWLKQPMSIGVLFWSVGHLLANGKVADIYLFGTFLVIAMMDILLSTLRGKVPSYQPRLRSDFIAVGVGAVLYVFFLFVFHPFVLNQPIVA